MERLSAFTIPVTRDDGSVLLFNTLYGSFAELNAEGAEAYRAIEQSSEIAAANPIAETLREGKFLIDAAFDERAWLHERTLADMNDDRTLMLCIAPTLACNLRCVYCYEEHVNVTMDAAVIEGVEAFVQRRYEAHPFATLKVLWYGGEPMLAVDVIGALSSWFIDWCGAHDVAYSASMVSNATLIDDQRAARLVTWGIRAIMPTLDGLAPVHDGKRRRADGGGSFEATMDGVRACAKAGMTVSVNTNLDATNVDDYRALRDQFADEKLINVYASQLRNYHDWCGRCGDQSCANALLKRQDYAQTLFDLYRETEPSAAGVYASLRPRRIFCRGQLGSYFVIDPHGAVTACDGFMGDPDHRLFNVCNENYEITYPRETTPWDHDRCASCALVPLCQGDCQWEWSMFSYNCSALKSSIDDYLRLLRSRLDDPAPDAAITLYIPPRSIEAEYAQPISPYLDAVMGL